MKRTLNQTLATLTIILISMVVLLVMATTAQAGILSSAKDWVVGNAFGTLLTVLFTVIAGFFGGTVWGKMLLKSKVPIRKLADVAVRVHEARRPGSPGGKNMTTAEKDDILKEVEELIQAIVTTFGGGK